MRKNRYVPAGDEAHIPSMTGSKVLTSSEIVKLLNRHDRENEELDKWLEEQVPEHWSSAQLLNKLKKIRGLS